MQDRTERFTRVKHTTSSSITLRLHPKVAMAARRGRRIEFEKIGQKATTTPKTQ